MALDSVFQRLAGNQSEVATGPLGNGLPQLPQQRAEGHGDTFAQAPVGEPEGVVSSTAAGKIIGLGSRAVAPIVKRQDEFTSDVIFSGIW